MGITLFGFSGLLAPLQSLIGWLAPAPRARSVLQTRPAAPASAAGRACARKPLRVVRVLESCQPPAGAGRMVISGRMADVCAELDRLAALEAAAG